MYQCAEVEFSVSYGRFDEEDHPPAELSVELRGALLPRTVFNGTHTLILMLWFRVLYNEATPLG